MEGMMRGATGSSRLHPKQAPEVEVKSHTLLQKIKKEKNMKFHDLARVMIEMIYIIQDQLCFFRTLV